MRSFASIVSQIVWKFLTVWLIRTDAVGDAKRKADAKANERMNDADLGIGAVDGDNIKWLRDFHDKHRN